MSNELESGAGRLMIGVRGQVTIFILVGILIVSVVLIFFLWGGHSFFSDRVGIKGFEGCVEGALEEGIIELESRAGFVEPGFVYSYMGEEFTYLCYTGNYYQTCTVQVPFLKKVFDQNIEDVIREKVDACYDASLDSLRDQGYDVKSGLLEYNVETLPGQVIIKIDAPTFVGDQKFSRFNVRVNSPVYEMLMIATSIVQSEAEYGDSDVSAIMFYHPDYYIEKVKRGDGTSVYILESKIFEDKFKFASRSLVFPAGYDL